MCSTARFAAGVALVVYVIVLFSSSSLCSEAGQWTYKQLERCNGTLRINARPSTPSRHVLLLVGKGIGSRDLADQCLKHGVILAKWSWGDEGSDYRGCSLAIHFPGKEITIMGTWADLIPFALSPDMHGHRVIIRDDLDAVGAMKPIAERDFDLAIGKSFDLLVLPRSYLIVFTATTEQTAVWKGRFFAGMGHNVSLHEVERSDASDLLVQLIARDENVAHHSRPTPFFEDLPSIVIIDKGMKTVRKAVHLSIGLDHAMIAGENAHQEKTRGIRSLPAEKSFWEKGGWKWLDWLWRKSGSRYIWCNFGPGKLFGSCDDTEPAPVNELLPPAPASPATQGRLRKSVYFPRWAATPPPDVVRQGRYIMGSAGARAYPRRNVDWILRYFRAGRLMAMEANCYGYVYYEGDFLAMYINEQFNGTGDTTRFAVEVHENGHFYSRSDHYWTLRDAGVPHGKAMSRVKEGFLRPANAQHSVRFVNAYRSVVNVIVPAMTAEEMGAGTQWYNPVIRCTAPN